MKDKIIFGIILIVIIFLMVLSGFGIWKASSFLFEDTTVSGSKEKIVNKPLNKIENWKHPDLFEFKNYKEFRLTDTLHFDLNGNGILEKVYFANTTCSKIIIEEEHVSFVVAASVGITLFPFAHKIIRPRYNSIYKELFSLSLVQTAIRDSCTYL